MKKETWKNIEGYDGIYQVSDRGRIKSLSRLHKIHHNYYVKCKTKILKQTTTKKGYLRIGLNKNNITKQFQVHRIVSIAFIPNVWNKPQINHKDGNKKNNYIKNLEWCNNSENQKHSFKFGLMNDRKGENHNLAKFTNKQILEIRKLYPQISGYKLAKIYNVHHATIYNIIHKKSWCHI
ncbi:MAG: NUMOD4 domain-containing protein [Candidatus Nanoarchaeia archaeon]|nr:NUMOD4 domain-containing protein [Candidatus Nanoarchaeia archaeon]